MGVAPLERGQQMQIAICDDDKQELENILSLLREYNRQRQEVPLTVNSFSSAEELLRFVDEHGGFDLYLLDIIMPKINGIQLGSVLRSRGDDGLIAYLTTSPDFAMDAYAVEAFHYLLKPIDMASLFRCLDKAADYLDRLRAKVISIKMSHSIRIVPVKDILYAERVKRLVCYYICDGSIIKSATFNGSFQTAVAPLLEYREFFMVGPSFAVNLCHVTEITKHDIMIAGGHRIAIPRRKYESFRMEWFDYWMSGSDS